MNNKQKTAINANYRTVETAIVEKLLQDTQLTAKQKNRIAIRARELIENVRQDRSNLSLTSRLMNHYQLSSAQGLTLMCLAEAFLRIPDSQTADLLIKDKLAQGDWSALSAESDSLWVRLSDVALNFSSKLLGSEEQAGWKAKFKNIASKGSEPVVRQAVKQAMRLLAKQFILGTGIEEAHKKAQALEIKGYRYSYDMLGEAAMTTPDAERYFQAYKHAINAIGRTSQGKSVHDSAGISVKLSALHPRFEFSQHDRIIKELVPKLLTLAIKCKENNIGLTVDAEEADVLELSLDIFDAVYRSSKLNDWDGLGLAVQSYQKRAPAVIDWIENLARKHKRKINLRLVKGAYWDTEIKRAQERCLDGYPVFTRKAHTDVSFIACANKLLSLREVIYPQFVTHNAATVATILELAGNTKGFEFQRLHGMGMALYEQIVGPDKLNIPCRIYAPVGSHHDLLPYLVRRLIENGANTSFVHHLANNSISIEEIITDPITKTEQNKKLPHPKIPLPVDLYKGDRKNFVAPDLSDKHELHPISKALSKKNTWVSGSIIGGQLIRGKARQIFSPADHKLLVGEVHPTTKEHVIKAFDLAEQAFEGWAATPVSKRAACLERMAELLEHNLSELMSLCIKEGGKTIPDALAEVREAADFCRYYASRAFEDFSKPKELIGPTGELNEISLHGRGVFVCISPWNFPLAIFTGQVAAALVAGNTVIAKPAEATPLIAARAVKLLHQAGIPSNVLHLLPGTSKQIGASLIEDPRVAGVAITGSVTTGQIINRVLAKKEGPLVPLIAETGGLNCMFVDSSALIEQVVTDVIASAFQGAGQRCSALRVLCIQEDIADQCIEMLSGAIAELSIGNPALLATDLGPVIDMKAKSTLDKHIQYLHKNAKLIHHGKLPKECSKGSFVMPAAFEIDNLGVLQGEKFGPILHVLRYSAKNLEQLITEINSLKFGLTLGIHSRIDSRINFIQQRMHVGNTYVNRNMIGAVVGVQPFGGEGLSGTGPKAGGPLYLPSFATERTLCINTMAQGGNAALMTMED